MGDTQLPAGSASRTVGKQDDVRSPTSNPGELNGEMANNPWQEQIAGSSSVSQTHRTINHRLSYDFDSGVIILPDDGVWAEALDSDSEDDTRVLTDSAIPGGSQEEVVATPDAQHVNGLMKTRYGTYFHHPERRWQSVPGAFPTGS